MSDFTKMNEQKGSGNGISAKLKRYGEKLIHSKHMLWGIGLASFLEALIIPIPLETILLPLMQARRQQLFIIASVVLAGCIVAASVGYFIGYFVFDTLGPEIVSLVSSQEQFESIKQQMQNKGFWFVFSVGIIPIPFQIAMLAAGVTQYSFWLFLLASFLSRAIRYFGLALLVLVAGNKAQHYFEKHKRSTSIIFLVIVVGLWAFSLFG